MARPDNPQWKLFVPETPHWGTKDPLPLAMIFAAPVYDSNGREYLESFEGVLPGVPFEFSPIPHHGREDLKANFPALSEVRRKRQQILFTIVNLRAAIFPQEKPTLDGIRAVVNAAVMYPKFFLHRANNPMRNGEISPEITGVGKAMRGIQKPLNEVHEIRVLSNITGNSGTNQEIDVSFLRSPEAYLAHVEEKGHLRTSEFLDIGCPADGPLIIQTLHALLDKPQITPEDARANLNLTAEGVDCLKVFGRATNTAALEEKVWIALEEHIVRKGTNSDVVVARRDAMRQGVLKRLNSAQRQANEALGRYIPQDLTLRDFHLPDSR